jgi:hypothetical protein
LVLHILKLICFLKNQTHKQISYSYSSVLQKTYSYSSVLQKSYSYTKILILKCSTKIILIHKNTHTQVFYKNHTHTQVFYKNHTHAKKYSYSGVLQKSYSYTSVLQKSMWNFEYAHDFWEKIWVWVWTSSQAKCPILAYSNLPLGRFHSDWNATYRTVWFTVLYRPNTNHIWSNCGNFTEKKFCPSRDLNRRPSF